FGPRAFRSTPIISRFTGSTASPENIVYATPFIPGFTWSKGNTAGLSASAARHERAEIKGNTNRNRSENKKIAGKFTARAGNRRVPRAGRIASHNTRRSPRNQMSEFVRRSRLLCGRPSVTNCRTCSRDPEIATSYRHPLFPTGIRLRPRPTVPGKTHLAEG